MKQYLIRLDDACPTMNREKWGRMEEILDKHGVKPMVGVIPHNEDPKQKIDSEDVGFWEKVKTWKDKGGTIALHGYNHCYASNGGMEGLNPMWSRSEFAGLPLESQREKGWLRCAITESIPSISLLPAIPLMRILLRHCVRKVISGVLVTPLGAILIKKMISGLYLR